MMVILLHVCLFVFTVTPMFSPLQL
uniref:Uncharacterized protein n=1 Tax=Tetranychus urticae TaxID=32264 RepID=T1K129_TETUR